MYWANSPRKLSVKRTYRSSPPSSSSRAGGPSPATRPVRALRCEPAACRWHPALASRWRGTCEPTPGAGSSGQDGSRVAGGGRTRSVAKAVCFSYPQGQSVGGAHLVAERYLPSARGIDLSCSGRCRQQLLVRAAVRSRLASVALKIRDSTL
jgi:hypothetical protein